MHPARSLPLPGLHQAVPSSLLQCPPSWAEGALLVPGCPRVAISPPVSAVGYGSWFEHVQEFWEHRTDANVLFLKYEDLHRVSAGRGGSGSSGPGRESWCLPA